MARYQLKIAYDGSHFFGFQNQGNARSVQAEIERSLASIGWQGKSILAAGRTDTGVHASGQVIAFDLVWPHSCEDLQKALNANLPEDIAVNAVKVARDDFHPRYDAVSRCYHYRIYCQPSRDPLRDRYAWQVWPPVEVQSMQDAAQLLLGTHDFDAFGKPPKKNGNTIRTVFEAQWQSLDKDWLFCVRANAFLYHMVRKLVFLQIKIGQGFWTVEQFREGIYEKVPQMPGLAKPNGLSLVEVQYQQSDCTK
ncbi:MAG: tRNA pseudouridine(38-40) synthase TruA [Chloroflexi bacterium HGW-Chloroflexi-10]|nr:MAG: tRNA pseudouridine(38-40) synthase TruA [Chloroflexi bacterium HGW-Chloroflexi-10]